MKLDSQKQLQYSRLEIQSSFNFGQYCKLFSNLNRPFNLWVQSWHTLLSIYRQYFHSACNTKLFERTEWSQPCWQPCWHINIYNHATLYSIPCLHYASACKCFFPIALFSFDNWVWAFTFVEKLEMSHEGRCTANIIIFGLTIIPLMKITRMLLE